MNVLIHICCAPCLCGPLEALRGEGHAVTGFSYNPNIHPLLEYRRRLKALKVLRERDPLPVIFDETYGLDEFLRQVWKPPADQHDDAVPQAERCAACYRLRLDRTARTARERGMEAFTTTMFASHHQAHDTVRRLGEEAAERHGVALLYRDFRPLAERSRAISGQYHLYHQSYCGCIFSEQERYQDTTQHLYRGPGGTAREAAGRGDPKDED